MYKSGKTFKIWQISQIQISNNLGGNDLPTLGSHSPLTVVNWTCPLAGPYSLVGFPGPTQPLAALPLLQAPGSWYQISMSILAGAKDLVEIPALGVMGPSCPQGSFNCDSKNLLLLAVLNQPIYFPGH